MRLGLVIVAGMAVLVLLISHDRGERGRLETFSETTAVGDQAYFRKRATAIASACSLRPWFFRGSL